MNVLSAIAVPQRIRRQERRTQVGVPRFERRKDPEERDASARLAAQLREVRDHSYVATTPTLFRIG